jgi:hypothetical protein
LKPGIDASLGDAGSLYSFTAKGKPRSGMSNPPMNPEVRAALMADLNKWEVKPVAHAKSQKLKNDEARREDKARRRLMVSPPTGSLTEEEAALESAGDFSWSAASAPALPTGALYGGSAGSSRISSGVPGMRRSASSFSHLRGSSPFARTRKKKTESTWQLDLAQEGSCKKYGLDTAPEGEVKWHKHNLKRQSREHGSVLDTADVGDLGRLSIYHNFITRGHDWDPTPIAAPVLAPSRLLRDLGSDLQSTGCSPGTLSEATIQSELMVSSRRLPRKLVQLDRTQEAPSTERLLEMSSHAKSWGPHRLQLMCQNARISVHTGAKLPEDADGTYLRDSDDPLFSSRNSTGKSPPVPYWGRNGNAPKLLEARASPEVAR